jgi:hypothetical protein
MTNIGTWRESIHPDRRAATIVGVAILGITLVLS